MKYALGIGLLLLSSCASVDEETSDPASQELAQSEPGAASKRDPAAGDVAYYGGRVIENAKVYVVWWGPESGIYSQLTRAEGGVADLFTGLLNSSYLDSMNRFNTDIPVQAGSKKGAAGTHQHIGRGNYAGAYTLTDVPAGNVKDEQVSATIEAAISAGTLPRPDDNTIYMLYFPRSVRIDMESQQSCAHFAGYHYITPKAQHHAAYAVIPDCGWDFTAAHSISSHELVEAITDVTPVRGVKADFPQAWSTSTGVEVSDLCTSPQGIVTTPRGDFTVQRWWDVPTNGCRVTEHAADDFAISASDQLTNLSRSTSTVAAFETTTTAGATQKLTLSVAAPKGVTATLSATSVKAGASVNVTLTVAAGATFDDAQVVVTAIGDGKTHAVHTASLLVSAH